MLHNRTKRDTYSNAGQADFPSFPTNCNKLVIRRECDGTYVLKVLDVAEPGMRCRVPKRDGTICRIYDKLPVLRQGNARVIVAYGKWPLRDC